MRGFIKKLWETLLFFIGFACEREPIKNDKVVWSLAAPKKCKSEYGKGPFIVINIFYGGCSCGKGPGHRHSQDCSPDWEKYVYLLGKDGFVIRNKIHHFPEKIPLSYLQRFKK